MRAFVFAVVALFGAATASAQEATATSSGSKMGVNAGLGVAFASPNKTINSDGEAADFPAESSLRLMLINLNVGYDFAAQVPGLYAGLDLPIAMNAAEAGGQSVSGTGLGDLSVYGGYLMPATDQIRVGGQLRFKAATGKGEDDEDVAAGDKFVTGSGFHNIQVNGALRGNFTGVLLNVDAGYIMTMGKDVEFFGTSVPVNPGDTIFANAGIGYQVNEMVAPQLNLMFATTGKAKADGNDVDGTESQWLAVGIDVNLKVNEMINAYVGWGTQLDSVGTNLPYGYVLSGKNTYNGFVGARAGVSASF